MTTSGQGNPTADVDLSFRHYLEERQGQLARHWVDGAPDYAFTLDKEMRQRLSSIGPLRALARAATSFVVTLSKQLQQMGSVAVGPRQYPEIYAMGEESAKILGIGVPQIFVQFDPMPNAVTYAVDDREPIVIMTTALVEATNDAELQFIIGHECGHIHNLHGVYNTMAELIANPALAAFAIGLPGQSQLIGLLKYTVGLFLLAWSRSAEVTCDRAGLICCGDVNAARHALAKLKTGGIEQLKNINLDEFARQLEQVQATPVRLLELTKTHPITAKRLEAIRLFSQCETLYDWRPELRSDAAPRPLAEVDQQCQQFISVLNSGYQVTQS